MEWIPPVLAIAIAVAILSRLIPKPTSWVDQRYLSHLLHRPRPKNDLTGDLDLTLLNTSSAKREHDQL